MIADQLLEGLENISRTTLDDGRAGGFQREGDDLGHLAGIRRLRAQPRVKHPGRHEGVEQVGLIVRFQPMPRRDQRFAKEGRQRAGTAPPRLARHRLEHIPRPQAATEQRKEKRCIAAELGHVAGELITIATSQLVECRDIGGAVLRQHQTRSIRAQHTGGNFRMSKPEPALFKLGPQGGIGGREEEQHEGGGHHIVGEAGGRCLLGADATADDIIALEHQHLPALHGQERCGDERIDAAAGDHIVRHRTVCFYFATRASTRKGEPVPCLIFKGAAMMMAPLAGSLSRLQRLASP